MNKVKLTTAIATAALLAGAVAPAAFAATNTTVNATGNGAFSYTNVKVKTVKGTTVSQTNGSSVTNVVNSKANTGNNTSNFNTGGGSAIGTGNATSNVTVTVNGSSNTANVTSDCNCEGGNTTVNVSGNGAFSKTKVEVKNANWLTVLQTNITEVLNVVTGKANTGGNDSSFNTGSEGSVVGTSDATSNVNVTVGGSSNTLSQ